MNLENIPPEKLEFIRENGSKMGVREMARKLKFNNKKITQILIAEKIPPKYPLKFGPAPKREKKVNDDIFDVNAQKNWLIAD